LDEGAFMSEPRAWAVFESIFDRSPDELTPAELPLVAVCSVRQEVNSGGFDSYFRYSNGDTAPAAVEAAKAMGSSDLAALISQAIDRLGMESYPADCSARESRIDDLDLAFDDLDEAFYAPEASDDLDARMETLASRIP
jgi:hypothetical protein